MSRREPEALENLALPTLRALAVPLVVVLALVVGIVTVWTSAANWFLVARDPESPVDTYLSYLEGGSSRQVMAPLLTTEDDGLDQVLTNPAYRAAGNRPQRHEFVGTRVTGDTAVVTVDVGLGDGSVVRRDYTVHLVTAWGPFNDAWQLREREHAPVTVRLPAAVDALAVNGQKVRPEDTAIGSDPDAPPGGPARTWRFEGLPGQYDVALPQDSYLVAGKHAVTEISLADPRPAEAGMTYEASPRMWEEVEREVQNTLSTCGSVVRFDAATCPVPRKAERAPSSEGGAPTGTSGLADGVSNVRWQLTSRPALLLEPDARDPLTFHAVPFRQAQARVTWLQNGRQMEETVSFEIEVTARTTGEHLDTDVRLRSPLTHPQAGPRPS